MEIEVSSICEKGLKRKENQDSILVFQKEEMALFVVADGMGGCADGSRASQMVVSALKEWAEEFFAEKYSEKFPLMIQDLYKRFEQVNEEIFTNWNQGQVCGSTSVILFLYRNFYGILSVGDSRIYQSRRLRCMRLTKDDVWENLPEIKHRFTNLKEHPDYGKLVHAVGVEKTLYCDIRTEFFKAGDIFALCSDGVYKMCGEWFLKEKIRFGGLGKLEHRLEEIQSEIIKHGAADNYSLILVRCKRIGKD